MRETINTKVIIILFGFFRFVTLLQLNIDIMGDEDYCFRYGY